MLVRRAILVGALSLVARHAAAGETETRNPSGACVAAIAAAERAGGIPPALLHGISVVESGRTDAAGRVAPWPWTVNAAGTGHVYETKAAAVLATAGFLAAGVRSIDVGCMQVNLQAHPRAFPTLEAAFEPEGNVRYAASFLVELQRATGSWQRATARYHSAETGRGEDYARRVMAAIDPLGKATPRPETPASPASPTSDAVLSPSLLDGVRTAHASLASLAPHAQVSATNGAAPAVVEVADAPASTRRRALRRLAAQVPRRVARVPS